MLLACLLTTTGSVLPLVHVTISFILQQLYEWSIISVKMITPPFIDKKTEDREVKKFAPGHPADTWQNWESNPRNLS